MRGEAERAKARAKCEARNEEGVRRDLVELLEGLGAARHPAAHGLGGDGDEPRRPPGRHLLRLHRPRHGAPDLARRQRHGGRAPPLERLIPRPRLLPRLFVPPHHGHSRRRELRRRWRRLAAPAVVDGRGTAAHAPHAGAAAGERESLSSATGAGTACEGADLTARANCGGVRLGFGVEEEELGSGVV